MRRILSCLSIAIVVGSGALLASAAAATPAPTTVTVDAVAPAPTDSGVHVNAGDTVTITATGSAACEAGNLSCTTGPDGNGVVCSGCWSATGYGGELVYGIDITQFANGGAMQPAGSNATFRADKSGELYLAYNDTDTWNNGGSYTVSVLDADNAWDGGLVQNGSFEGVSTPVSDGGFSTPGAGSTLLDHWTVGDNGVDVLNDYGYGGPAQPGADGNQYLDMSALDAGSVSQTLTTIPGAEYQISFAESQNSAGTCSPEPKALTASFGSTTPDPFSAPADASWANGLDWTTRTFNATATDAQTPLTFTSDDACSYGPLLDAVSVTLLQLPTNSSNLALGTLGNKTFGAAPFAVAATSDSPQPISYSSTGPCTVVSTTGIVSLTGAGLCTITASQPAQTATTTLYGYTAGSVQRSFTVYKATASIQPAATTIEQLFTQFFTRTAALRATFTNSFGGAALSGLPVSFTTSSGTLCRTTTDGNGVATCPITTFGQLQQLAWGQAYHVNVLPNRSLVNGGAVSNLNVDTQTLNVAVPLW